MRQPVDGGFESGFEERKRVNVTEVRREGVPKLGSRATEGSAPHGDKTGRGDRELERRGGVQRAGGSVNVEEIRDVLRSEVMKGFECSEENFEIDALFNW
ncbi:hypothetical protein WMY93_029412 [Mugilogobius chulae]|uniref:Uncharacterized protein n=1 Tax=Mugilogobius chulae TaxID=88201 RepID=A0AAW0MR75_9GOBI